MTLRSAHEKSAEVFDFWLMFEEHERAGHLRPLEDYVALFPHCRETIARLYAEAVAPPTSTGIGGIKSDHVIFGPYRVTGTLGQGGQGTVYSAEDTRIKRRVALKVLSTGNVAKSRLNRLRREAESIARLDHPNICRCLEAQLDGPQPFIAMSHIEGATLAECLAVAKREERRTPDRETAERFATILVGDSDDDRRRVLTVFEAAARALAAAHRDGIVHRDVKPGNIMIRPDLSPVILDFGLASDLDESNPSVSEDGVGTPNYMSPEQVRGGRKVDGRSDVFSLGATLYECLTLAKPFAAPTIGGVIAAIGERDPIAPRTLRPTISADLDAVVATALEKEPSRRYATAEAFADDLLAVREGRITSARAPNIIEKGVRLFRRHKAASVVALVVAALAIVGAFTIGDLLRSLRLGKTTEREILVEQRLETAFTDLSLGRSAPAAAVFEEILANSPGHIEARAGLALALFASNRRADALRSLAEAPPGRDDDVLRWVSYRLTEVDHSETRPTTTPESSSAFLAFIAGEIELIFGTNGQIERANNAVACFRRALVTSTNGRDLYRFALARAARLADDRDAAAQALVALSKREVPSKESLLHVGIAQSVVDPKAALATFEEILRRSPDDRDALLEIAPILADLGRFDEAHSWLEKLNAVAPDDPIVKLARLRVQIAAGDFLTAAEEFQNNSVSLGTIVAMATRAQSVATLSRSPIALVSNLLRRSMDIERSRIRRVSPLIDEEELRRESARSLAERLDEATVKSFVRIYADIRRVVGVTMRGPDPTIDEWWSAIAKDDFLGKVVTLRHVEWTADAMYEYGFDANAAEIYDFLAPLAGTKDGPRLDPRCYFRAATVFARRGDFAKSQRHLRAALANGGVDEDDIYELVSTLSVCGRETAIPMVAKEAAARGIDSRRVRLIVLNTLGRQRRFDEAALLGAEDHEDFLADTMQDFYGRRDWKSVIEFGDVLFSRGLTSAQSHGMIIDARLAENGRSDALTYVLRLIKERRLSPVNIEKLVLDWLTFGRFPECLEILLASNEGGIAVEEFAEKLRRSVEGILPDEAATERFRSELDRDPQNFSKFVRWIAHFGSGNNRKRIVPGLRSIAVALGDRPDVFLRNAEFLVFQGDKVTAKELLQSVPEEWSEANWGQVHYFRFLCESDESRRRAILDEWRSRCPRDRNAMTWTAQHLFNECNAAGTIGPITESPDAETKRLRDDLETVISCCRVNRYLRTDEPRYDTWEQVLEGRSLYVLGRIDEARAVLLHAERHDPDRAILELFLAELFDFENDLERAATAVARAEVLFDDPRSAWGRRCRELGERIRARTELPQRSKAGEKRH